MAQAPDRYPPTLQAPRAGASMFDKGKVSPTPSELGSTGGCKSASLGQELAGKLDSSEAHGSPGGEFKRRRVETDSLTLWGAAGVAKGPTPGAVARGKRWHK